jgi:RNA polymerase sigma-70 factor (ECF subfamily)
VNAVQEGDVDGLTHMLSEDVVVWTDGGGKVFAALEPVRGREKAARFIMGSRLFAPGLFTTEITPVNGRPAVILRAETGQAFLVISIEASQNQIQALHVIGNPDKLRHL